MHVFDKKNEIRSKSLFSAIARFIHLLAHPVPGTMASTDSKCPRVSRRFLSWCFSGCLPMGFAMAQQWQKPDPFSIATRLTCGLETLFGCGTPQWPVAQCQPLRNPRDRPFKPLHKKPHVSLDSMASKGTEVTTLFWQKADSKGTVQIKILSGGKSKRMQKCQKMHLTDNLFCVSDKGVPVNAPLSLCVILARSRPGRKEEEKVKTFSTKTTRIKPQGRSSNFCGKWRFIREG